MSSLEDLIVAASSETNTSENWTAIIQICERADKTDTTARDAVSIITKRVQHKNVNVVLFTLTIANSLVQNCGMAVKREICSRVFVDALVKLVSNRAIHETIRTRVLDLVQHWAEAFKSEPSLGFMVDTYNQLKAQNYQFPSAQKQAPVEKSRSQIQKEKEDEELQLALAMSMSAAEKEEAALKRRSSPPRQIQPEIEFHVRALYDFPGSEEGELAMARGDIVAVYDSVTFRDWWKGGLRGRNGIFPANYVEKIVGTVPVETGVATSTNVGGGIEAQVMSQAHRLDEFAGILASVDPRRDNLSENERLQDTYNVVLSLRPKIIKAMEASKAKRDELGMINDRFLRAIQTYQHLMELAAQQRAMYSVPPPQQLQQMPPHMYQHPPLPQQQPYGYAPQY
ncbi:hypothetical protein SmJEL517_g05902 [Synchytrium microbalum]|uniref:Class E vacuolar protein-sorting machinery protein HSE1 n=1 Tax=Synchytrium microbalum TaxID=1806994 RepID=A0A507BZ63_9FUNG|nr:uncharacterized protein SmJEL517_g05902 [Synchytrium microbalum]TPX30563.1 hypothetical protein SmJEL517_g05902 [Synchytrium microbalum]